MAAAPVDRPLLAQAEGNAGPIGTAPVVAGTACLAAPLPFAAHAMIAEALAAYGRRTRFGGFLSRHHLMAQFERRAAHLVAVADRARRTTETFVVAARLKCALPADELLRTTLESVVVLTVTFTGREFETDVVFVAAEVRVERHRDDGLISAG
jgi:hypothetical protein